MCVFPTWVLVLALWTSSPYETCSATAEQGGLRRVALRGPGSGCSGILEARHQSEWRSLHLSRRSSRVQAAQVVCRQVGCGSLVHIGHQHSRLEPGPSWEVEMSCWGNETTLGHCLHAETVRSREKAHAPLEVVCSDSVRLAGGEKAGGCTGVLMVRSRGGWSGVCGPSLPLGDGQVICRELGCGGPDPPSSPEPSLARPDLPEQKLFGCRGNETRVRDCGAADWSRRTCQDQTVTCRELPPGPLRVVGHGGASGGCQGLLEVRYRREWRPVGGGWETKHSQLACSALQCGAPASLRRTRLDRPRVAWEPSQQCRVELWDQPRPGLCKDWRATSTLQGLELQCSESLDSGGGVAGGFAVRLVPRGKERCWGRVEVLVEGSWVSVDQHSLNQKSYMVVCKELGCGFYAHHYDTPWPASSGPLRSVAFDCRGNESTLAHCPARLPGNATTEEEPCALHLRCAERLPEPEVSFSSTTSRSQDGDAPEVQRGHAFVVSCSAHTPYAVRTFRLQARSEWLQPAVNGSAHFLFPSADRGHRGGYRCSYSVEEEPGVFHRAASLTLSTVEELRDVRLEGGASRCEGRLEVLRHSQWRPIVFRRWGGREGGVVCRQLGCGELAFAARAPPPDAPQDSWRFLSDCGGAETELTDCGVVRALRSADPPVLVVCTDILVRPDLSLSSMMGSWSQDQDPDQDRVFAVREDHSFTITCSTQPQYPGGAFSLLLAGTNHSTLPALNHTSHFLFPAAGLAHQGNFTCVYVVHHGPGRFTSNSSSLYVEIIQYPQEVMLVWGSSPCAGRLLVSYQGRWDPLSSVPAGWGMRQAAIVCSQLRCGGAVSTRQLIGRHSVRSLRYFSDCQGSEGALFDCGAVIPWMSDTSVEVNCEARQRDTIEDYQDEDYSTEAFLD